MKTTTKMIYAAFAVMAFISPTVLAVSPPPDGAYPGANTAEGYNALLHISPQDGGFNTAVGWCSLFYNVNGSFNTGVGAGALDLNIGHNNTAVGAAALLLNITATGNTAVGTAALALNNADGNTAIGALALVSNVAGPGNTAVGVQALQQNAQGNRNTAVGAQTLTNILGSTNTAVGAQALMNATGANGNTAVGAEALIAQSFAFNNTAVGAEALSANTTGGRNIAVGSQAGNALTKGDDNIYIGNSGQAEEANTIRIGTSETQTATYVAGIYNQPAGPAPLTVMCGSDGKLSANASSRRYKHDIKPIDKASEAILALKPVSFRYNNDSTNTPWSGLIAEDVAQVSEDLIVRDNAGNPLGVRYDQVNAMLLNEFLKEHKTVQDQGAIIARQQKQIEALSAGLQKVSAQLELSKPARQIVGNDHRP